MVDLLEILIPMNWFPWWSVWLPWIWGKGKKNHQRINMHLSCGSHSHDKNILIDLCWSDSYQKILSHQSGPAISDRVSPLGGTTAPRSSVGVPWLEVSCSCLNLLWHPPTKNYHQRVGGGGSCRISSTQPEPRECGRCLCMRSKRALWSVGRQDPPRSKSWVQQKLLYWLPTACSFNLHYNGSQYLQLPSSDWKFT